jgi:hypothetical protein
MTTFRSVPHRTCALDGKAPAGQRLRAGVSRCRRRQAFGALAARGGDPLEGP